MRGTAYAVAEIVLWMVAAAAVSFGLAWVAARWSTKRSVNAAWEQRLESERERARQSIAAAEASAAAEVADTRKRITELEHDLGAANDKGEILAAELAALEEHAGALERRVPGTNQLQMSDPAASRAHVTAVARRLAAAGATGADDLTTLPGVGPSLAAAMSDLGLISYGQVAALTPDDARHLEAALGIPRGRSDIDGWAAAAAQLDRRPSEDDASSS